MDRISNDDRREYMAGLMELMQQRCSLLGVSYSDEMATLVLAWLVTSRSCTQTNTKQAVSPARVILPDGVASIPEGVSKPFAGRTVSDETVETAPLEERKRPSMVYTPVPISQRLRASKAYLNGVRAARHGDPRESCPIINGQGGYRKAWLVGYDETVLELRKDEDG